MRIRVLYGEPECAFGYLRKAAAAGAADLRKAAAAGAADLRKAAAAGAGG